MVMLMVTREGTTKKQKRERRMMVAFGIETYRNPRPDSSAPQARSRQHYGFPLRLTLSTSRYHQYYFS